MNHEFNHGTIYHGDCLELMKDIPDKSIDMVMADLPYGTTACHWDSVIPFKPPWEAYKRITKDKAAIVLTASQPFTSALVMSNIKMFKYCWVWKKTMPGCFVHAKNRPIKYHEDIIIFSKGAANHEGKSKNRLTYNPQMTKGKPYKFLRYAGLNTNETNFTSNGIKKDIWAINKGERYPSSIISVRNPSYKSKHPTQKPVALFEYLIRTYTDKGDLVLDNVIGSGTTGIACHNLFRRFIGMEKDVDIYRTAVKRIDDETRQLKLFE